jgi:hypothetical protein
MSNVASVAVFHDQDSRGETERQPVRVEPIFHLSHLHVRTSLSTVSREFAFLFDPRGNDGKIDFPRTHDR